MLSDLSDRLSQAAKRGVDKATAFLKMEIDKLTPEDTQTLLRANKAKPAKEVPGGIVGAVVNDTPYAAYVEYGVRGKTYRYHKPRGVVAYRGVGARMFTRAFDGNKDEIARIVSAEITKEARA